MCADTTLAEISARDCSLFRTLIRTSTDGVLVTDEDGIVLIYNPACARIFQHMPETILGNNVAMLLAPSCRDSWHQCRAKIAEWWSVDAISAPTPHECFGLREEGSQFPMQITLGEGELDGRRVLLFTVHDLSSLYRERVAHGEETAYLALIVESSNDAIISYGLDGTIRSWNRGAEEMFGYKAEEIVGVNVGLLVPLFVPPDLRIAEDAIFERALAGDIVRPHESVRLHRNGTAVAVLLSASPIRDGQGQIVGIARTLRDIGERHIFEQQRALLSDIVASSSDAIISYALDGTITSWNRAAEHMYGYSAYEMIGSNFYDRICAMAGLDLVDAETEIGRKVIAGERTAPFEATRTRKNGTPVYVLVSVSPIRGPDHAIIGASRTVRDLSESKECALRLDAMRQDLIHVARIHELNLISAGIAHELNQPLSAILNYSNAARHLVTKNQYVKLPEITQKIGEQADRAAKIIQRMRDFVEKRAPHRAIEDINAITDDAVELALIDAKTARIETTYERAPNIPPVLADRVQIQQVVVNLLRNAMEAMSEAPRRKLRLAIRKRADSFVEVLVSDTGHGIPPQISDRLFKPFVTTKPNGMGIGLTISKTIIEAHGGALEAEANPGGGTIFRFTLPVIQAEETAYPSNSRSI